MAQILEFIGNHKMLVGALGVALVALIAHEVSRLFRGWKELDTLQAVRLINREEPLILDVSGGKDFAAAHIRGAEHMPPSRIEAGNQQLTRNLERPVLVYCRSNQVAPQMANRLTRLGLTQVYVLAGGLNKWIGDQQPVVRPGSSGKQGKRAAGKKSA